MKQVFKELPTLVVLAPDMDAAACYSFLSYGFQQCEVSQKAVLFEGSLC